MSQFVYLRGARKSALTLAGLGVKKLSGSEIEQALDSLFGHDRRTPGDWCELETESNRQFAPYFDTNFQSVSQRDRFGRSFAEVLAQLAESYDDVVLAYGPPDVEIARFTTWDTFFASVIASYADSPVELHLALIRSGQRLVDG